MNAAANRDDHSDCSGAWIVGDFAYVIREANEEAAAHGERYRVYRDSDGDWRGNPAWGRRR